MKDRALRVTCPIDDEEAIASFDSETGFSCSHKSEISSCAIHCSARAVLCNPEEPVRMRIVCPEDMVFSRVVVKDGEVTWCSHEHERPDCQRNCLKPCSE